MYSSLESDLQDGLPEVIEEFLEEGYASCLAFNYHGTILATGTNDGSVVIWDFETRRRVKKVKGHEKGVTCLSWCGEFLASGSVDMAAILWNIKSDYDMMLYRVLLPSPILMISLAGHGNACVASLAGQPIPVVFNFASGPLRRLQPPVMDPSQFNNPLDLNPIEHVPAIFCGKGRSADVDINAYAAYRLQSARRKLLQIFRTKSKQLKFANGINKESKNNSFGTNHKSGSNPLIKRSKLKKSVTCNSGQDKHKSNDSCSDDSEIEGDGKSPNHYYDRLNVNRSCGVPWVDDLLNIEVRMTLSDDDEEDEVRDEDGGEEEEKGGEVGLSRGSKVKEERKEGEEEGALINEDDKDRNLETDISHTMQVDLVPGSSPNAPSSSCSLRLLTRLKNRLKSKLARISRAEEVLRSTTAAQPYIFSCIVPGILSVHEHREGRIVDLIQMPTRCRVLKLTANAEETLLTAVCSDNCIRVFEVIRIPGSKILPALTPGDVSHYLALAQARTSVSGEGGGGGGGGGTNLIHQTIGGSAGPSLRLPSSPHQHPPPLPPQPISSLHLHSSAPSGGVLSGPLTTLPPFFQMRDHPSNIHGSNNNNGSNSTGITNSSLLLGKADNNEISNNSNNSNNNNKEENDDDIYLPPSHLPPVALFRVSVEFCLKEKKLSFSNLVGRTAHIEFIESSAYVTTLVWGLLLARGILQPVQHAWV